MHAGVLKFSLGVIPIVDMAVDCKLVECLLANCVDGFDGAPAPPHLFAMHNLLLIVAVRPVALLLVAAGEVVAADSPRHAGVVFHVAQRTCMAPNPLSGALFCALAARL